MISHYYRHTYTHTHTYTGTPIQMYVCTYINIYLISCRNSQYSPVCPWYAIPRANVCLHLTVNFIQSQRVALDQSAAFISATSCAHSQNTHWPIRLVPIRSLTPEVDCRRHDSELSHMAKWPIELLWRRQRRVILTNLWLLLPILNRSCK